MLHLFLIMDMQNHDDAGSKTIFMVRNFILKRWETLSCSGNFPLLWNLKVHVHYYKITGN